MQGGRASRLRGRLERNPKTRGGDFGQPSQVRWRWRRADPEIRTVDVESSSATTIFFVALASEPQGRIHLTYRVDWSARRALLVAAVRTTGAVVADDQSGLGGRICQVGAGQVCAVQDGTGQRGAAQGYRPLHPVPRRRQVPLSHHSTRLMFESSTPSPRRMRAGTDPEVPSLIGYGPCIASTSQDRPPSW